MQRRLQQRGNHTASGENTFRHVHTTISGDVSVAHQDDLFAALFQTSASSAVNTMRPAAALAMQEGLGNHVILALGSIMGWS